MWAGTNGVQDSGTGGASTGGNPPSTACVVGPCLEAGGGFAPESSQGSGAGGGGLAAMIQRPAVRTENFHGLGAEFSSRPVRYSSGEINIVVTDLSSTAFGESWGYTRSWSNRLRADYGGPYGVN